MMTDQEIIDQCSRKRWQYHEPPPDFGNSAWSFVTPGVRARAAWLLRRIERLISPWHD
jgi:hypothetical protein